MKENLTDNCKELILDDIVAVELYDSKALSFGIPPIVPLSELSLPSVMPEAAIRATLNDDAVVQMTDIPTLKIVNERKSAGNIFTHELAIPVQPDNDDLASYVLLMQTTDYHVVYSFANGDKRISYALPNTTKVDIDQTVSGASVWSLKLSMQSLSGLVMVRK